MRLAIRHETLYRYTAPLNYTIQQLRLTPRIDSHQQTLQWHIDTPGLRHAFTDAFGNLCHMLTITGNHDAVPIVVSGEVDVTALVQGRLHEKGTLSPLVFTTPTRLIAQTESIQAFSARHLRGKNSPDLMGLAEAICGAVSYQSGATAVTSTADEALHLGSGVCQDHAHLFIACCHAQDIPARYVSGYIDSGSTGHAESHAWVDVWVEESAFTGWISIDVTHAMFAGEVHCRLAVARDYDSAAPVSGIRRGGGEESLEVSVNVTPLDSQ
ncbi:MAG: transglutaminase family protein [Oxalicibacterium faecigallinarum]|uniref:transglutaminase family protein n=1 Tax=Oxalicibacterium faecigallinarum TaxID=573741 RepID=UPI002806728C|nr:transglutaminase family protein [Oxalicibacterium faecigallinarum]MDQ7969575.1 transglutaminase family protein [Oxalicibacterium faecigallinarum]